MDGPRSIDRSHIVSLNGTWIVPRTKACWAIRRRFPFRTNFLLLRELEDGVMRTAQFSVRYGF